MSVRPYREILRRKCRQIHVGSVPVGGDAPISVQSMTNTPTTDVAATIASIRRMAGYTFDAMLPGHLAFSLDHGKRHVEAACAIADRLLVPPSIV